MKATSPELIDIARRCFEYEEACAALELLIAKLESRIRDIKDDSMKDLKRGAAAVASLAGELTELVGEHPHLFRKPRTLTLNGVRVGFMEQKGSLEIDDEAIAIAKLRCILGQDDAEAYIQTKEILRKDQVRDLDAKILSRIGARIAGAGDQVIVKRAAGDIEKLLNKMVSKLVEAISSEA